MRKKILSSVLAFVFVFSVPFVTGPGHDVEAATQTVTTQNFIYLSSSVYNSLKKGNVYSDGKIKWQIIDVKNDSKTGFYGAAFKKPKTNEIVIAFRGTESSSKLDIKADKDLARGILPKQVSSARSLVKRVVTNNPKNPIFITGHSLGGWLTQKIVLDTKSGVLNVKNFKKAVTFNAPGFWHVSLLMPDVMTKTQWNNNVAGKYNAYITNYIINIDLVGAGIFSEHLGKRYILPYLGKKDGILQEHGIKKFKLFKFKNGEIVPSSTNDNLLGAGETLHGGRDSFDGGAGNDSLSGYAGNDNYIFKDGYGTDTIKEYSGKDTLYLYLNEKNLKVYKDGKNLVIAEIDSKKKLTSDRVIIKEYFNKFKNIFYDYKVETIVTKEKSWNMSEFLKSKCSTCK